MHSLLDHSEVLIREVIYVDKKMNWPRTEPCGTLDVTGSDSGSSQWQPSILIHHEGTDLAQHRCLWFPIYAISKEASDMVDY